MKIGIVANILQDKPLREALEIFASLGIETLEPGCGGYAGKAHVNPAELLGDAEKLRDFRETVVTGEDEAASWADSEGAYTKGTETAVAAIRKIAQVLRMKTFMISQTPVAGKAAWGQKDEYPYKIPRFPENPTPFHAFSLFFLFFCISTCQNCFRAVYYYFD